MDDMAGKGLFFVKTVALFSLFEKGAPSESSRFRFAYIPKEELSQFTKRKEWYREHGWEYVTDYGKGIGLYRAEGATELEIDLDLEGLLQAKKKELKEELLLAALLLLFAAWASVKTFLDFRNREEGFLLELIHYGPGTLLAFPILWVLVLLILLYPTIQTIRLLRKGTREELLDLGAYEPHKVKRMARRTLLAGAIAVLLFRSFLLSYFWETNDSRLRFLDPAQGGELVLLDDISPEEGARLPQEENPYEKPEVYGESYFMKENSLLTSQILRIRQHIPWGKVGEEQSRRTVWYNMDIYAMRGHALAERLAKEMTGQLENPEQLEAGEGVLAIYSENREVWQSLVLPYQKFVLRIGYEGSSDLREALPLFERQLKTESEWRTGGV